MKPTTRLIAAVLIALSLSACAHKPPVAPCAGAAGSPCERQDINNQWSKAEA
jgi:hypothetical protein